MFGSRKLRPNERVIVAVHEIRDRPGVGGRGVNSDLLIQHPSLRDYSIDDDLWWAVDGARKAGWLDDDDLLASTLDGKWHDIRLSQAGEAKIAELTRPRWKQPLGAVGATIWKLAAAVIVAAVSGVIVAVILGLF